MLCRGMATLEPRSTDAGGRIRGSNRIELTDKICTGKGNNTEQRTEQSTKTKTRQTNRRRPLIILFIPFLQQRRRSSSQKRSKSSDRTGRDSTAVHLHRRRRHDRRRGRPAGHARARSVLIRSRRGDDTRGGHAGRTGSGDGAGTVRDGERRSLAK